MTESESDYVTEYMKKLKQHPKIKTCKICGKQFQTFVTVQCYCSEACRRVGTLQVKKKYNEKKHPKIERQCDFCHKRFFAYEKINQHFCCQECANKYRRILQRIYKIKDYYGSQFDFEAEFKAKGCDFRFPEPFSWLNEWCGLEGDKS